MSIVAAFGDQRLDADLAAILALSGDDISGRRDRPVVARSFARFAPVFAAITTALILIAVMATRTGQQIPTAIHTAKHVEQPARVVVHTLPVQQAPLEVPVPARFAATSILPSGPAETAPITTIFSKVPDTTRRARRVQEIMPSRPAIPRAFAFIPHPAPSDTALAPAAVGKPSWTPVEPAPHAPPKVELASTRIPDALPLPTSKEDAPPSLRRKRQDGIDAIRSLRRQ